MMNIRISGKIVVISLIFLISCNYSNREKSNSQLSGSLSEVIKENTEIVKLAEGFQFTEGPA